MLLKYAVLLFLIPVQHSANGIRTNSDSRHVNKCLAIDRLNRIRSYSKTGDALFWEGIYKGPSGTLGVSRDHGYVIVLGESFGTMPEWGTVTVGKVDPLTLCLDCGDPSGTCEKDLVAVEWAERLYLVPTDGFVSFCNDANSYEDPGATSWMREGDEKKRLTGSPKVPIEFRKYLLNSPVSGIVTQVHSQIVKRSVVGRKAPVKGIVMEISSGKDSGLEKGMSLFARIPRLNRCFVLELTSTSGTVILDTSLDRDSHKFLKEGITVHSRLRESIAPIDK